MSNTNCKDNKYKYMMVVEECFFVFMLFVLSFYPFYASHIRVNSCNSWLKIYVPSPARNLLLSFVVYCCSYCRFLLSVPSLARNLFVQIRAIRGKIYSFRAMRGTPFVVPCCLLLFLLSFSSFRSEPCEEPIRANSCYSW